VRTELRSAAGYPDEKMYSYDHVPVLDPEDISDAVMYLLSTSYHVNVSVLLLLLLLLLSDSDCVISSSLFCIIDN
jgi:NADP-dependent 3-hydroxy acid dehydrogenase YdfG